MSASSDVRNPGADPQSAGGRRRRPRRVLLVGAVLIVVALVIAGLVLVNGQDGTGPDRSGTAAATSTPAPRSSAAPSSEAPTGSPSSAPSGSPAAPAPEGSAEELPAALPAVSLDEPVAVEEVTASIALIEEIDGRATGPGDVAGPALRVTVRIVNGQDAELDLSGVAVNMTHGDDRTPASPLDDPSHSPFTGLLAPGDAAEGVYVFRIPDDLADDVTVEVGYRAGGALAVFTGPVR